MVEAEVSPRRISEGKLPAPPAAFGKRITWFKVLRQLS
ncbi:hypothetical protein SCATT_31450 [Streptantibioticus cattleyicolor NRRL 8057 = DSM 46488]|uniref:Uncharacterized protein n=1 Tax=Streptantibioticus cattleyicolor (strain ATCC 35852 / DSM 46488 / JCM 4925 / NBRC 14057 / NRRL 8057) TaxID=1003195 RepID=G8WX02_STREN|nr:hypothetical protein SCATT_31450 [Streptantibioticus cattleyicolor NRRL 8057 = DSM 46488]